MPRTTCASALRGSGNAPASWIVASSIAAMTTPRGGVRGPESE
jgi:hypothetical protein